MEKNEKYTWDLTKFCKDEKDFEQQFKKAEKLCKEFVCFEGKLKNKTELLKFLKLDEQLEDVLNSLYNYVMANSSVDVANAKFKGMRQRLDMLMSNFGVETAFVMPEILGLPDKFFDDVIADKVFADWKFKFMNLKKQKAHVLTKEQEQVVSVLDPASGSPYKIFQSCCYVDVSFGKILDSKGKEHELTRSNFSKLMQNKDEVLRKNALNRRYEIYDHHLNTLSTALVEQVQKNICYAKLYKYNSVLDRSFAGDNMDRSFYDNLIEKTLKLISLNKKYNNLVANFIKKQYKLKKLNEWDLSLPLGKKPKDVSFEELVDITKKSLKPLGEDFVAQVQRALDERWIDVMPAKNKESGAWCSDCYGKTPIIMLNFEGEIDDQFVHEVGHAIRFELCSKNNSRSGTGSTMFIEETFSTVNQTFFARYLIDNAKDKQEKIYYLTEYLSTLFHYVVGSVLDSVVEDKLYQMVANNEPINKDIILNYAKEQYSQTWNDEVKKRHLSVRTISMMHYYSLPYYVWQYACGQLNANFIVNRVEEKPSFVKKYFDFMKSGSTYPLDMLKLVDIDYNKNDVFDEFEKELNKRIQQLQELL